MNLLFFIFCLLVAYIPFSNEFLRFEIFIVTVNAYEIGVLFLLIGVIWKCIRSKNTSHINHRDIILLMWAVVFLISTLLSKNIVESGYLAYHAIFIPVVSYFVVKFLIESKIHLKKIKIFYIYGCIGFSIISLIEYALTHSRVEVLSMPPIGAATILSAGFIMLMYSNLFSSVVRIVFSVVIFLGLIVTFSRLYIALVVISPVIYYLIRRGLSINIIILSQVLTLAFTIYIIKNNSDFKIRGNVDMSKWTTYERITDPNAWKLSIYNRSKDLKEGLDNFDKNSIVGTGLKKGRYVTRHNLHIEWLEYSGLLGYLLITMFLWSHYYRFGKMSIKDKLTATNLLIILCIFVNGVFNGLMHGVMPMIMLMLMGMNEAILYTKNK